MSIHIAVGSLAGQPPDWLSAGIVTEDVPVIASAANPRRRLELLWSRGLKAGLLARMRGAHCVSIAHDRRFAAVAVSRHGDIGIDLQTNRTVESCRQIAETWFPDPEAKEILESEGCDRFMRSWVIKEAWAKCMNQSIFESCRTIAVWEDHAHIPGGMIDVPQFAWSRQRFGGEQGVAIGVCYRGKTPNAPNIDCYVPGPGAKLRRLAVGWHWLPVAA